MSSHYLLPAMVFVAACARPQLPVGLTLDALVEREAACQDRMANAEDHRMNRIQVERDIAELRRSIRKTEATIEEMLKPAADASEGL